VDDNAEDNADGWPATCMLGDPSPSMKETVYFCLIAWLDNLFEIDHLINIFQRTCWHLFVHLQTLQRFPKNYFFKIWIFVDCVVSFLKNFQLCKYVPNSAHISALTKITENFLNFMKSIRTFSVMWVRIPKNLRSPFGRINFQQQRDYTLNYAFIMQLAAGL
jgi:hypothetical protein